MPQVHVDQTKESATSRVYRHVPDDADELVKHRFQIINLWRPIAHPAYDWPLALCDYRTVDRARDLVPTALKYPERDGQTFSVKYNPNHKWYYLSNQTPDEVTLIKCYDSEVDRARLTPHSAFPDASSPAEAPHRESIEIRALVFDQE